MWLLFTFISLAANVTFGIVAKKFFTKSKYSQYTIALLSFTLISLGQAALAFFTSDFITEYSKILTPEVLKPLTISMLMWVIMSVSYYRALRKLPVSLVFIAMTFSGIYGFIIHFLFKGVAITPTMILGSIIIFIAVIGITNLDDLKKNKIPTKEVLYFLFGGVLAYTIASTIDSYNINTHSLNEFAYGSSIYMYEVIFMLIFFRKITKDIKLIIKTKSERNFVIFNALINIVSSSTALLAFSSGANVSIVLLIISTQVVFVSLLSHFLLKEPGSLLRKLSSAIFALVGVAILTL